MPASTSDLIGAALTALPSILGAIRAAHQAANPGAPELTEAQALEALHQAVAASLARDQQLRGQADLGGALTGEGPTFGGSTGE